LPAGLGIFYGVATGSIIRFWRPGVSRIFLLAWALFAVECLRGHILTGLPWNLLGYSLTGTNGTMQLASVFGVYVLTYFAVLGFAVPAALLRPGATKADPVPETAWRYAIIMLCLLILSEVAGQVRLSYSVPAHVEGVRLRIIQPNIPQTEKWQPGNREWITEQYFKLGQKKSGKYPDGLSEVTHLIWPEVAQPFLIARDKNFLNRLAGELPKSTTLITGAIRIERPDSSGGEVVRTDIMNSLFVFNSEAQISHIYDKQHLVPFGEYLPFQGLLELIGLEQLTRIRGGFTAGSGPSVISLADIPSFRPLICYEAIFSGAVNNGNHRPSWMLNVTNDGWFGDTAGPHQHLQQARIRAVEEGLPLVRAANTGISAIIDPYGRILFQLSLNNEGIIDSGLPVAASPTVYSRFGLPIMLLFLLFGLLIPVYFVSRKVKIV
ncbi:MAG: apolipoprotein N-acyltransferase, partial [Desulfobulbia bacterium]